MKFRNAYAANPVSKFDLDSLDKIAENVVYVCATPIREVALDGETSDNLGIYANIVETMLADFDSDRDMIIHVGDPLLITLMLFYLSDRDHVHVGRYSRKHESYVVKKINTYMYAE
jgi:hypothetical protein